MIELWQTIKHKHKKTKYIISSLGRVVNNESGELMKPHVTKKGYLSVSLWIDGKSYGKQVHRLVAKAFIPNPHQRKQVNHINGNKQDNRIENLEWVTNKQNSVHATKNGLCHSKLTDDQVKAICKLLMENKLSYKEIAKKVNVSQELIGCIYRKQIWKRIVDKYNFPKRALSGTKKHPSTIRKICRLIKEGYADFEIAMECNTYEAYVNGIRHGKRYKSVLDKVMNSENK